MRILIVEDEDLAASRLELLFKKQISDFTIVGIAKSITEATKIIENNEIDLGFFDIHIEDGLSFSIFEKTEVKFPVIFTTAYNDYAIKAFKFNSIDYLLKPISGEELKNALDKFIKVWQISNDNLSADVLNEMKELVSGVYKERFTVKIGNRMELIKVDDICYFYSFNKGSYAKSDTNRDLLIDNPLDLIFPLLNPKKFFRISRKHIVNIDYIKDIYAYSKTRLKVNIKNSPKEEMIVSREKVNSFKKWLENN